MSRPESALPGDVWRQVTGILLRTAFIAIAVAVLDIIASAIPQIVIPRLGDQARADFVGGLFRFFSLLPPLLLALASFAVTGLSLYGNPALILLYRWHQMRWWERPFLLVGQTNLLYRTMVLGLGLVSSLFLLQASKSIGLSSNSLPALAVVVMLAALLSANLVAFVLWVISLRRPSDVIQHTYQIGCDLLRHLKRITEGKGGLIQRPDVGTSAEASNYEEQEDMKRCVYALTETAVHALEMRQRLAAREATDALARLDDLAQTTPLPDGWEKLGPKAARHPDWLEELFVDAIESVIVAAADLHYFSVGRLGAERLAKIGTAVADYTVAWRGRRRLFERVLEAFTNTIDECVVAKELELGGLLLLGMQDAVKAAINNQDLYQVAVRAALGKHVVEMLTRCVIVDDIPALRSALARYRRLCEQHTEPVLDLTAAIFSLGAIALASRTYGTGSVLVDEAALRFDPDGSRFEAAVRIWPPGDDFKPTPLPVYVTKEYFQVFLVLALARSLAIKDPGWQDSMVEVTRRFTTGLTDRTKRATVTIWRMGKVVSYPDGELTAWVKAVEALDKIVPPALVPPTVGGGS